MAAASLRPIRRASGGRRPARAAAVRRGCRRGSWWQALAAAVAAALAATGCGTVSKSGGGFYQQDGPPAQVPADILSTPDAVPKIEPFHSGALRPYVALGRSYTPITDDRPLVQRGQASWYGRQFHGSRTAIGEIYDMFAMTAAHPTMPLPSYARVTNLGSGVSVIVRVNDRGPFREDRVIDLSYAAAMRLGIAAIGTGEVEVERITQRAIAAAAVDAPAAVAASAPAVATAPIADRMPAAPTALATLTPVPAPASLPTAAIEPSAVQPVQAPVAAADGNGAAQESPSPRWAVQVGAFALADNAQALLARLQQALSSPQALALPAAERLPRIEHDGRLHRVLLGALPDREAAMALATRLAALLGGETPLYVLSR